MISITGLLPKFDADTKVAAKTLQLTCKAVDKMLKLASNLYIRASILCFNIGFRIRFIFCEIN